ncbi:putative integral membrane domain protein [Mycobacterium xenopi 4042]|uniref:Putative integral membrane domain protein n=1 Tax=Mycobacterium xenopi 4042 TaxID=1299334 RepID=X7ZC83_MYCXE|nr:putative integral membrane domain protein [Mycobacterium xenopi 4042]
MLDGEPVAAQPCEREPIALPAGQQELVISPATRLRSTGPS